MNAIKKKLQTLKVEKELAIDRAEVCEQQAKEAVVREEKLRDQVDELEKKLAQMKCELEVSRLQLGKSVANLENKEKAYLMVGKACYNTFYRCNNFVLYNDSFCFSLIRCSRSWRCLTGRCSSAWVIWKSRRSDAASLR